MNRNHTHLTSLAILGLLFLALPLRMVFGEDFAEFRTHELQCVIGNNAAMGEHHQGYNGVFRLTSIHQPESLFVPEWAGLNLEHYFDGSDAGKDQNILFEPRRSPMEFHKIDDRTAELRQPPTPYWKVESITRFRLADPYYIDVTFQSTPRESVFQGGAMGVFWAGYINNPSDKSIFYLSGGSTLDKPQWQQFCTQYHTHDSTVKSEGDSFQWKFFPTAPEMLYTHLSKINYSVPFYYGRFQNMVWIVVFPEAKGIRFAHSPSGGGATRARDDQYPAWDFQFIVPDYKVGQTYQTQYRAIYKVWAGREDVLKEVKRYLETSGSRK